MTPPRLCDCRLPDRQLDGEVPYCGACGELLPDPRDALLATLARGVASLDRKLDLILERLDDSPHGANGRPVEPELIDAAEVARRFGFSRDYVYEHSRELGAVRLGDGPKARLRFSATKVAAKLDAEPPAGARPGPRRRPRSNGLLPVKDKA